MLDEKELERLTEYYWLKKREWGIEGYIKNLLPKELEYLRETHRMNVKPAEILVQLVGLSWEPLLITVCAYKPEMVVLILNKWYELRGGIKQPGRDRGDKYKEYVNKLKDEKLIENKPSIAPNPCEPVEGTTQDVFRFLKKNILQLDRDKRVVIDITGAKKSMVSGTYLFAAYTDTRVCYLDADRFNEESGQPYGYTSKIDELNNPMNVFKLHEWDRVKQLYENYTFRTAKELVEDIKSNTKPYLEDKESESSIALLVDWLEFYDLWNNGDFKGSWNKINELRGKVSGACFPSAVEKLGEIWPDKRDLSKGIAALESSSLLEESFYLKDEENIVYAEDELAKIQRLIEIGRDYRSALIRACGLNEFLLKARVVKLWAANQFVVEMNDGIFNRKKILEKNKEYLQKIDKEILEVSTGRFLYFSLSWKQKKDKCMKLRGKRLGDTIKAHRSDNAPLLNDFCNAIDSEGLKLPHDAFELRNKAVHFCLVVPEKIAKVLANMVEENLKDFRKNWVKNDFFNGNFKAIAWDKLCDLCRINFLSKKRFDKNE